MKKQEEKEEQIRLMEEYNRLQDKLEQQRLEEWERREKKIKDAMDRMGEVYKKSNKAEMELENRIMREQMEKDQKDEAKERKQREQARQRDIAVKKSLDEQIQFKYKQKEHELIENQKFIKMVITQDERDKRDQLESEKKAKEKRLEVKDFQLKQIGEHMRTFYPEKSCDNISPHSQTSNSISMWKRPHGIGMSIEELRLNKPLLKEISRRKKEEKCSVGALANN